MRLLPRVATVGLLAAAAAVLAACGSSSTSSTGSAGNTIDIYSSLPLKGAVRAQSIPTVNGINLALSQTGGMAGQWRVNYISLDDATTTSPTNYDLNLCQDDARKAAADPKTVYYIGAFDSGCSKVTVPILSVAGIPEVSPRDTYVGLTTNDPGSAPGEPQIYYPTDRRNYLRLVPRDTIQGIAGLSAMKRDGCTRIAVANDKTAYGVGLAAQLQLHAAASGIRITSDTPLDPGAGDYTSYAQSLKGKGINCVYTAFNPPGEVALVEAINAALPKVHIYAGDGVCTGSVTNPAEGGFPTSIAPLFHCTIAPQGLTTYPGGRAFLAAYRAKYGVADPDPYAIYGYEAMKLALDTIAKLGPNGNNRSAVLKALFATTTRRSLIGTYGFDRNGDTTLRTYGLYKVGKDGNPQFERTVQG